MTIEVPERRTLVDRRTSDLIRALGGANAICRGNLPPKAHSEWIAVVSMEQCGAVEERILIVIIFQKLAIVAPPDTRHLG